MIVSNCCNSPVTGDICDKCQEHCVPLHSDQFCEICETQLSVDGNRCLTCIEEIEGFDL